MTTPSSRLLSLAREIRNHTYHHLSHEIRIRWRWNHWPLSGTAGIATIILENAPYTSVLLSCSRLRDEYLEAEHFRNLHLTIVLSLDENARYITEDVSDQRINDQILPRLKSVTVLLTNKGNGKMYEHLWFNVFILSKMLATRSSNLEIIKVVAHERREVPTRALQLAYAASNMVESQPFFPCPYDRLAELPLRKHEEVHPQKSDDSTMKDNSPITTLPSLRNQDITPTAVWTFASVSVES